mgnify:FL=1
MHPSFYKILIKLFRLISKELPELFVNLITNLQHIFHVNSFMIRFFIVNKLKVAFESENDHAPVFYNKRY